MSLRIRTPKEIPQKLIEKEVARILTQEVPDPSKDWDKTGAKNLVDMKQDSKATNILSTMKRSTGGKKRRHKRSTQRRVQRSTQRRKRRV